MELQSDRDWLDGNSEFYFHNENVIVEKEWNIIARIYFDSLGTQDNCGWNNKSVHDVGEAAEIIQNLWQGIFYNLFNGDFLL